MYTGVKRTVSQRYDSSSDDDLPHRITGPDKAKELMFDTFDYQMIKPWTK